MKRSALLSAVLVAAFVPPASAGQLLPQSYSVVAAAPTLDGGAALVTMWAGEDEFGPIRVALRRTGGMHQPFSDGVGVSGPGEAWRAGLAADGSGVALTWGAGGVGVVSFDGDGTMREPEPLSTPGVVASPEDVAVAPSGAAVAVWTEAAGLREHVRAAVREPGALRFGPSQLVFPRAHRRGALPDAAIGDGGDAVVTIGTGECDRSGRVVLRRRGAPSFGPPQSLGPRSSCDRFAAVGADGTVVVTHARRVGRDWWVQHDLAVRRAAPGAAFLGKPRVFTAGTGASPVDVAVSPSGRAVVAWERSRGGFFTGLDVLEAAPGGPFTRTATLGDRIDAGELAADVDDAGRAVVAWVERAPRPPSPIAYGRVVAAVRPEAGAAFGSPRSLHDTTYESMHVTHARLAPGGRALVAWTAFNSGDGPKEQGLRSAGVSWLGG